MGKNLKNNQIVMRDDKVAFYTVPGASTAERMQGFSSLSGSKSASEHSVKYVDERSNRTFVTGYDESISYTFDQYKGNNVLNDIVEITDQEKIGSDAVRTIIQVDMTTLDESTGKAKARKRDYAVVPDSYGDDSEVMTYSGTLKCNGDWEEIEVTSSDDWDSVKEVGSTVAPVINSLSVTSASGSSTSAVTLTPAFSPTVHAYTIPASAATVMVDTTVAAGCSAFAAFKGASWNVTGKTSGKMAVSTGDYITITVTDGSGGAYGSSTYSIQVK